MYSSGSLNTLLSPCQIEKLTRVQSTPGPCSLFFESPSECSRLNRLAVWLMESKCWSVLGYYLQYKPTGHWLTSTFERPRSL
jgi:hypothetical protein